MKKIILAFIVSTSFSISLSAQKELKIAIEKSIVNWKGSQLFGFGSHYGTVKFKEGKLIDINNKIIGGTFVIDMSTIINTDGDYSEDLVGHLKNEDFFDVEKHPMAKLVITNVEYDKDGLQLNTKADLTIKGVTRPIKYTAVLNEKHTQMTAKFIIDRSDWNVTYGSRGVEKVKDYIISDAIEFKVELAF